MATRTSLGEPRRHPGGRPATGQMGQCQVRLPADWLPALDKAAREQGMTRSGFIRWLIGQHLKGVRHDAD